jgi:hypothetical protein
MANTRTRFAMRLVPVLLATASSAGYGVTLSFAPQELTVTQEKTSSFDIQIGGLGNGAAPSLGAYDLSVTFDPSVIDIEKQDVELGTQLDPSVPNIVLQDGNLRLLQVSLKDPEVLDSEQPGSFRLATVPFEAREPGTSQLELGDVTLGDAFGSPIEVMFPESGEVRVVAPDPVDTQNPLLSEEGAEVGTAYNNACKVLEQPGYPLTAGQQGLLQTCATLRSLSRSDPAAAAELLNEAVPRITKPAARTGIGAAQQQDQTITVRLTKLRGALVGPTIASSMIGIDGQQIDGQQLAALFDALSGGGASSDGGELGGRWGFFVNGSIGKGDRDKTQLENGFDVDVSNITAGVDYRLTDQLILGAAVGYVDTDADFDSSPNETQVDGWSAIVYGTYMPTEGAYVDAVVSAARDRYDVRRLDPFSGLTAKGDTDGTAFSASLAADTSGATASGPSGLMGGSVTRRPTWTDITSRPLRVTHTGSTTRTRRA